MSRPSPVPGSNLPSRLPLLLVAAAAVAAYALAHHLDLFERFAGWAARHEALQVDELMIAAAATSMSLLGLTVARWRTAEQQARALARATGELARTQQRLGQVMEASPVVLFTLRHDGTGLAPGWISGNFGALFGHAGAPESREWWMDHVHPADRDLPLAAGAEALAGRAAASEFRFRAADGGYRWILEELRPATAHDGSFKVVGSWTDITRRRGAEEALRASETRFRAIFSNAGAGVLLADLDGRVLELNPALEELLGRTAGEIRAAGPAAFVPPDSQAEAAAAIRRLWEGAADAVSVEQRYLRPDGGEVWANATFSLVRGPDGEPLYHVAVIKDITARHRAEQARAEIEERYRLLADRTEDVVSLHDADGRFVYVSPSVGKVLGGAPEALAGTPVLEVVHEDDRAAVRAAARDAAAQGSSEVEWRLAGRFGATRWFCTRVTVLPRGEGGRRVLCASRDVTARKHAEEAVRFQAGLLDAVEQAVIAVDLEGRVLFWNGFAGQLYGWSAREAVGRSVCAMAPSLLDDARSPQWERVRAGGTWTGELELPRRDGTVFPAMVILSPIRDAQGTLVGAVSVSSDLTAQRQLELQFRQAQKMEAIGRLAGGVAHDFNNMLTAIRGNAQLLLADLPPDVELREDVQEIDRAAARAADLTRQLLAFSRSQVLQPRLLDLNAAVRGVEPMLRRLIGEDVEFVTVLSPGLGTVRVDPTQVEQIILNLVVNARDAMPGGGTLRIETRDLEPDAVEGVTLAGGAAAGMVRLSVSDTGCGMSPETVERIFEPFFTTKGPGSGTGLGLSTVYGIVSQSGGTIRVHSRPGDGSTFCIYLPRVAGVPEAQAAEGVRPASPRGAEETVLLVEDEETVSAVAYKALSRSGYRVLRASRPLEALELFAAYRDEIRMVVTDVVMPEMSGRELAERLHAVRPALPVLFTSGYMESASMRPHAFSPDTQFLAKPFSPEVLVQRVRQVLEDDGSATPHAA
jgi:two-component system, cell cycle sensor histidine kinase and response regulator CckA